MDIFHISISVVLVLVLGNYFENSIVFLLCYSVELALVTLIVTLMGPLPGNYLGRSLEAFLVLIFYLHFVQF